MGVAYAPALTPIFVVKDAGGEVRGVPRDLGEALAKALRVPAAFFAAATTAEVADALDSGAIDIGFISPPYFFIDCTYLAAGPSNIATIADVDQPEVTVVGIAGSATMQAAARSLRTAKVVTAKSVDESMAMMKARPRRPSR